MVGKVYERYDSTLRKNNAMDFDDLLLKTVELFEQNEDILEQYQNRFRYIMVDEYQDTNMIQYTFVKLLADARDRDGNVRRNLCVVGDDDQCIYQWRGADIRNILEFEKDFPGAKTVKLEQNYRSTANILAAAHSVISHNKGRKAKTTGSLQYSTEPTPSPEHLRRPCPGGESLTGCWAASDTTTEKK